MANTKIWDLFVRLFHWSLVLLLAANVFILDDESKFHQWAGYAVAALILARILWGFWGSHYARFNSFPPSLRHSLEQLADVATGRTVAHAGHTPLGALMIYNLLASVLLICLSGYLMTTDMFWGAEWPEELHEAAVTWVEISVVLHVAAVLFESLRTKVNLPRAMITGYKNLP
jgi:cytochrome b